MAFNRKQRLRDNIEAIRTAFILDREQRTPTARERLLLERYCGFGGLKCILNPAKELTDAVHWAKSDLELFAPTVELHRLVRENCRDEMEYKRYMDAMKQSVLTAFYTPPEITDAIADVLHGHGIRPDRVLEPSAGVGAFVDAVLGYKPDADIMAFEKDLMTGRILKHLHPDQKVRVQGFEKIEKPFTGYFDLVISNIPFGDVAVFDPEFTGSHDPARRSAAKTIHNYFFLKSLDTVREGGIVAFITSQGVLDAPSNAPIREYMMRHANPVGVARLPNNLFTDNAGTEVGSDLIILQKNSGKKRELYHYEEMFIQTGKTPIGSFENGYVGSIGMIPHSDLIRSTDPYGKPAYKIMHRGDIEQMAEDLREHLSIEMLKFDKKLYVRQKVNGGTGLPCLTYDGKQTVYQIQNGIPPFIAVFVNTATGLDSYCQSCRQSIYYRGTYAVQTAAGLICGIVEFTAGMQSRKYQTLRADPFFVHTHGNTTTVIFHGCGAVGFQCHLYRITISGQMLVHRVINDLVDQMIQSLGGDTADIHSGSLSYRF